jgi:hypothetical protein
MLTARRGRGYDFLFREMKVNRQGAKETIWEFCVVAM